MTAPVARRVNLCWFREVVAPWRLTAAARLPLVVRADHVTRQEADVPHRHQDFYALYIVRQGRGIHVIDGAPYAVARGDVYVMGQGVTHWYSRYDALVLDALYFQPDVFDAPTLGALAATPGFRSLFIEDIANFESAQNGEDRVNGENGAGVAASKNKAGRVKSDESETEATGGRKGTEGGNGRWLHLSPDAHLCVEAELAELRAEWQRGDAGGILLARGLFARLLVHLARQRAAAWPGVRPDSLPASLPREITVAAAVRYMDENFARPLRIEQVAAGVFLSPDRFTEVFSLAMGRTPRDYLRHVRLERAKSLLTTTDAPVAEIGVQVGFGEAAYFNRVFRAATGTTPRAYRRQSAEAG